MCLKKTNWRSRLQLRWSYVWADMELRWSGGWSTGTVGWLSEWGRYLKGWPAMNTKCLVPLPFLPDLILWSSEKRSHGSPMLVPPEKTVIRLGWSRIGLAVLILHAACAGLIGRPAVISGRYNKCHSLQLHNHYAHFPPLQHTHIHAKHDYAELVMGNDHGFRGIVCWPWEEESCVIG